MSTRAVVIDSRFEGKGFWVKHDGYPTGLGVELKELFKVNKSIEQVCLELVNMRTEKYLQYASRIGSPIPDMSGDFMALTPEQVKACKKLGSRALWSQFGIDASYIYRLRKDGVYVVGATIPKSRKVKAYETDRG